MIDRTEGHYIEIWVVLLLLLGVSILLGASHRVIIATLLIFVIAVVKAFLVATYYMRLKWEPRYIVVMLLGGVVLMLVLYFALVPDILYRYGS